MFNLNIFKKPSGPESPEPHPNRCHFQHQNGRRCRLPVADESTEFCGTHRDMLAVAKTKEEQAAEAAAITAEIYGPVKSLDSAVAINHVLGNLFRLTLEGRIPQRKAALLTSMCRTLLKSVGSARAEITAAKLFPNNNSDLLNLLAAINGENAESENVAPDSSPAAFAASNSLSQRQFQRSVVAACPEQGRGDRPGVREMHKTEEPSEFSIDINRKTVAPNSSSAVFAARTVESTPALQCASDVVRAEFAPPASCRAAATPLTPQSRPLQSPEANRVIWIGPKPSILLQNTNDAAEAHLDDHPEKPDLDKSA